MIFFAKKTIRDCRGELIIMPYLQATQSSSVFQRESMVRRKFSLVLDYSELQRQRNDVFELLSNALEELKRADDHNVSVTSKHIRLKKQLHSVKMEYSSENDPIQQDDLQKVDMWKIKSASNTFKNQINKMKSLILSVHNIKHHLKSGHDKAIDTKTKLAARHLAMTQRLAKNN